MNILFIVNWKIHYLAIDSEHIQPADKAIVDKPYWFFKYWPGRHKVDVLDFSRLPVIHRLEKDNLKFFIIQALRAYPRLKHYDLIISHGAQSGVVLALIRQLLGKKHPPHILIDVGCFNGGRDNSHELRLVKYASQSISGIIYHAPIQREYYQEHLPNLIDSCFFVPFGYDADFFYPLENAVSKNYIAAIGYQKRDYQTLIKAWKSIKSETRLKIIGIKSLRHAGIDDKLPQNVDLLPYVPISELKKLIGGAKFVVLPLPYFKYAYGQKTLLEAMAMGKAVIVTKTPSTEDYVIDQKTGMFVKHNDVNDMQSKLRALLNNQILADRMGKEAFDIASTQLTAEIMSKRIFEIVKILTYQ